MRELASIGPLSADFVAKVFCPSECVRLIQDQASMRNVDSRINSLRFDCCVFLFYSFSAVTFATWGNSGDRATRRHRESALQQRMRPSSCGLATMESCDGTLCRTGRVAETDIDLCGEPGGISRARGRSRFRA